MYACVLLGVTVFLSSSVVLCRMGADLRKGETSPVPWNTAPPARITHRNKGDTGDVDPRGSVRYNFGPNGRIMRGIITRHREVPADDEGTGVEQAKEECCFADSYD